MFDNTDVTNAPVRIHFGDQVISGSQLVVDSYGVKTMFESITGWWDLPPTTGTFVQRQYSDGGYVTDSRYGARTISLKGWIIAPSRIEARKAIERFKRTLSTAKNTPLPLVVVEDEVTRYALVKLDKDQHLDWDMKQGPRVPFDIQFLAAETRIIWGNGSGYEYSYPTNLTASGTPAQVTTVNEGVGASPLCQIVLDGFDTPTITHVETGQSIKLNLNLPLGQPVTIDFDKRSIRDSSGASVRGRAVGRLFKLSETVNTFQISAATYSASSLMTTKFSSASN